MNIAPAATLSAADVMSAAVNIATTIALVVAFVFAATSVLGSHAWRRRMCCRRDRHRPNADPWFAPAGHIVPHATCADCGTRIRVESEHAALNHSYPRWRRAP